MQVLTQRKKVTGKHIYGELYGCNPRLLSDPDYIKKILMEAVKIGGFTLLDARVWHIQPGVSGVAIILESHISIHTWPEYSFATVDVYTCGEKGEPVKSFHYIVEVLEAKRYTMKFTSRDYEENE
ncbi:MAG: adenosylmethionine decarboxylase [Desulfurococcaceae archaeon]